MSAPTPSGSPRELEIVTSRVFASSREKVYNAFADPEKLVHWWGPKDFTNTFQQFDLHAGGAWRFVMHGPDGANYTQNKQFTEVVKPERIVFRHNQPEHDFTLTMTFATHAGDAGTLLTWRMVFDPSPHNNEPLRQFIAQANEQNFDRLAAFLKTQTA